MIAWGRRVQIPRSTPKCIARIATARGLMIGDSELGTTLFSTALTGRMPTASGVLDLLIWPPTRGDLLSLHLCKYYPVPEE